jgi:hypothetical protein
MRFRFRRLVTAVPLGLLMVLSAFCAHNPAANLAPVGKAAYYGDKFMRGVEEAQNQTIGLVGQFGITRADVTPAVEVFVKIGRGGQDMAAALKVIDESTVFSAQQDAATRVRAAADTFSTLLTTVTARVSSETARTRITQILDAVKLGISLLDVIQRIAPLLPQPGLPPVVKAGDPLTLAFTPAWAGGAR